jgi:hypothetical protein
MGARDITRLLLDFSRSFLPRVRFTACWRRATRNSSTKSGFILLLKCEREGSDRGLDAATALHLEIPFHWLLGMANGANLDRAVELIVEDRLVGALCEVEATGFDLTRTRPARALSCWGRTVSLAAIPTPSHPSVPASTLLAWHFHALRRWGIPFDKPKALAGGQAEWADPAPRIDLSSLKRVRAKRMLFLGQTLGGEVFGAFANRPLSRHVRGRDPALTSAIFVLEHPTGEQRRWHCAEPGRAPSRAAPVPPERARIRTLGRPCQHRPFCLRDSDRGPRRCVHEHRVRRLDADGQDHWTPMGTGNP